MLERSLHEDLSLQLTEKGVLFSIVKNFEFDHENKKIEQGSTLLTIPLEKGEYVLELEPTEAEYVLKGIKLAIAFLGGKLEPNVQSKKSEHSSEDSEDPEDDIPF